MFESLKRPSGRISRWKVRFIRRKVAVAFIARKRNGAGRENFPRIETVSCILKQSSFIHRLCYQLWNLEIIFIKIITGFIFFFFRLINTFYFEFRWTNIRIESEKRIFYALFRLNCFNKWISVEIFLHINFQTFDSIVEAQPCKTCCANITPCINKLDKLKLD